MLVIISTKSVTAAPLCHLVISYQDTTQILHDTLAVSFNLGAHQLTSWLTTGHELHFATMLGRVCTTPDLLYTTTTATRHYHMPDTEMV